VDYRSERERERDLSMHKGSGGIEVIGERSHGGHNGQNGYGEG